jgi:hypothetical protein
MPARHRAVGEHRAFLVVEAQRLADAVQVVVHVVQPEGDAVRVAAARRRLHVAVAVAVASEKSALLCATGRRSTS